MSKTTYDRIGRGYANTRRADPRIAAQIEAALGDARSVVNVERLALGPRRSAEPPQGHDRKSPTCPQTNLPSLFPR